jgi:uncharacterized metal-binding protein YceD (DUF177 family)
VRLDEISREAHRRLTADEPTRARIAELLDLVALNSLEAEVEVRPIRKGGEVHGRLKAEVVQTCGVTLEPFETRIQAEFTAQFTTEANERKSAHDEEFSLEDLDEPDLIENGVVDLGGYVVEHLALEIDPFPRKPDAVFEAAQEEGEPSPFAALAKLKQDLAKE